MTFGQNSTPSLVPSLWLRTARHIFFSPFRLQLSTSSLQTWLHDTLHLETSMISAQMTLWHSWRTNLILFTLGVTSCVCIDICISICKTKTNHVTVQVGSYVCLLLKAGRRYMERSKERWKNIMKPIYITQHKALKVILQTSFLNAIYYLVS